MQAFCSRDAASTGVVKRIVRGIYFGCRGSHPLRLPSFFVSKTDGRVGEREFEEDISVMLRLEAIEYLDGSDGRMI